MYRLNRFKKGIQMDKYERRARVYPAIAAMVIPGVFAMWVFQDQLTFIKEAEGWFFHLLEGIVVPALIFSAVGYVLRSVFRSTSKFIFQNPLFKENEIYMPTTNYLFWNDDFFSEEKKERIYSKILDKYQVNIPKGNVKKRDERSVRKIIAEAVEKIRVDFREKGNNDSIVLDYNIQYGMYRNLFGGLVWSCLFIAIIIFMNAFYSFTNEWISSVIVIIMQLFVMEISLVMINLSASEYAKSLINYFDQHM